MDGIRVRDYTEADAAPTLKVFRDAVTVTGSQRYTAEQIVAWAGPPEDDLPDWHAARARYATIVALVGDEVVGQFRHAEAPLIVGGRARRRSSLSRPRNPLRRRVSTSSTDGGASRWSSLPRPRKTQTKRPGTPLGTPGRCRVIELRPRRASTGWGRRRRRGSSWTTR